MASERNIYLIKNQFSSFLKSVKLSKNKLVYKEIFEYLEKHEGHVFLFGGAVRDIYFKGKDAKPNDFDVVLANASLDGFLEKFNGHKVVKNNFGGYKILFNGVFLDVWEIENTWAFKNNRAEFSGIASIFDTTFLSIESIMVEINPKRKNRNIYYRDFFRTIDNEILDINLKDNPLLELCYSRIIHFSIIHKLFFSKELVSWMKLNIDKVSVDEVLKKYEAKYGIIERDRSRILEFFKDLMNDKSDLILSRYFIKSVSIQSPLFP